MESNTSSYENIEVPITEEELIVVSTQELPGSSELLSLLPKTIDLKYWIRFAIAYYKQGRIADFEAILSAAQPSISYVSKQTKQALLSLLSFYSLTQFHSAPLGSEQRKKSLEEAQARLSEAEKLDPQYQVLWVVRGVLYLEKENYEQAEIQFQTMLSRGKDNVPSLCGMAISFMRRNEWKKALRFWQSALRIISMDPKFPLGVQCNVRLGIGTCFGRLGMLREAKCAFLRVLDFDSEHPTALVMLSSLSMNNMRALALNYEKREALALAFQYVTKAFHSMRERQEINPIVIARLSDLLFFRNVHEKSFKGLKEITHGVTNDPSLLSEIHYYLGRYHHVKKEFDLAQTEYSRSLSYSSENLLAKYALGQILIYRSQYSQAIESFDFIRSKLKQDNYDVIKMLAYLHAHLAENAIHTSASIPTREYEEARENCRQLYARAIELFKTLHAFRSTDPEECGRFDTNILIMYSRLLESSPLATPETRQMALKLYLSARDLLTRANKPVPAELLNNLGVLYHVAGDHLNSSHFFMDALKVIRGDEKISLEDKDALESTLLYNLGRCYEEVRKDDEAERFYNAVLQRQPLYHDSNLRLGMIEQAKGHLKEAASYFIKVVDQAPDNVEAHILLGILQLTMNQTRSARKNFEKVLHSIDKFDLVSLLLLGNIWLFSVNRENKDKALTEAWKMYEKVLLLDPRNPYAANGIAIALRDRGCLEEALRLFEQVREADDKVPCFMVNYAHILSELGQFKRAIPLYEKAMARFFENKNVDILVSTARAYYQLGKTTKSADHLQAALKYLQLALHIFPKDKTLWFNLAIVLQDHTVVLSSERMDKISVGQMREAVRLADLAIRNLTWLASTPSDQYDQHIASQRVSYTRSVKEKLEKRIDELIETQEDRQKRLSEMIQQKQLEEASIHQKKSMELAQKQKEMEHVLKTYQSMNEKIRDELKVWDALQLKAQRRVKDSDGFVVPESAEDNLEDDPSYYSRSVKPSSKYPKPMDETGDRVSDPFVSNVVDENTLTSPSHFTQFSDEIESTEFEQATKRRRLKKRDGQDFNSSSSFDLVMQSQPDVEQID